MQGKTFLLTILIVLLAGSVFAQTWPGALRTNGGLHLNLNETVGNIDITFHDADADEIIRWNNTTGRFYLTASMELQYNLWLGSEYVYFSGGGASLRFNSGANRFDLTNSLYIPSTLIIEAPQTKIDSDGLELSLIGSDTVKLMRGETVDAYTDGGGLWVNEDLRVGQGSGSDNDTIYLDSGAESITWHNLNARIEVSDDVYTAATVRADNSVITRYSTGQGDLTNGALWVNSQEETFNFRCDDRWISLAAGGPICPVVEWITGWIDEDHPKWSAKHPILLSADSWQERQWDRAAVPSDATTVYIRAERDESDYLDRFGPWEMVYMDKDNRVTSRVKKPFDEAALCWFVDEATCVPLTEAERKQIARKDGRFLNIPPLKSGKRLQISVPEFPQEHKGGKPHSLSFNVFGYYIKTPLQ